MSFQGIFARAGLTTDGTNLELDTGQHVKGSRFIVTSSEFALAELPQRIFIAPAPCKLISAYEIHRVISSDGGLMQLEKCNTGEAATAGEVMLGANFLMTSTAATPVTSNAVTTTVANMVAGDSIYTKLVSGNGTNYADGIITATLEWL